MSTGVEVRAFDVAGDPEVRLAMQRSQRMLDAYSRGEATTEEVEAAEETLREVLEQYVEERAE